MVLGRNRREQALCGGVWEVQNYIELPRRKNIEMQFKGLRLTIRPIWRVNNENDNVHKAGC